MATYSGKLELLDAGGNVLDEVTARFASRSPSYTELGTWGGELHATGSRPDPFFDLMGVDGLRVRIANQEGDIIITSCVAGGRVAQVVGSGDPPF